MVVAELGDSHVTGRGECVPYARYGESADSVIAAIEPGAAVLEELGLADAALDRVGLTVPPDWRRALTLPPRRCDASF